jgi:N utilization substance protein B
VKSRSAARELALIVLPQIDTTDKNLKYDIDEILISSVRTLVQDAESELQLAVGALVEMREFIDTYETEHQANLTMPIDYPNIPVPMPMTSDMSGRINCLIDVAEKSFRAMDIAELAVLEETKNVKDYAKKLLNLIIEYSNPIDEAIKEYSIAWDVKRLVSIDKCILRIAIAELLFMNDIPLKVTIDEAVELAKKFSTDDSSAFINGLLGKLVEKRQISKSKQNKK